MTPTFLPVFLPALEAVFRAAEPALHALFGSWRRHAEAARRRRQERAWHRSLCALDERTLRDLGIDRSELQSIARHPADPERLRTHA